MIKNEIAENINKLMQYTTPLPSVLNHGDFHLNNILKDKYNKLIVCDWQNVGIGKASDDLSFLISRATADGLKIYMDKTISLYCNSFTRKSGKS